MEKLTLEQITGALTFIIALGAGIKYLLAPVIQYNHKQKEIDDKFGDTDEKLDNDNKRINRLENDTKQVLLTLLALLQHNIDGNDVEALKKRKSELSKYMVEQR